MNICGFKVDDTDTSWIGSHMLDHLKVINNPQSTHGAIKDAITDVVFKLNYNLSFIEKQTQMIPQYNYFCYNLDYFDKAHISENLKEKLSFAITQWLCVANTKYDSGFDLSQTILTSTDRPEFLMSALQIGAKEDACFNIQSESGLIACSDFKPVLDMWLSTVKERMNGNILSGGDLGLLKHLKEKLNWLIPITVNVRTRNEETLKLITNIVTELVPTIAVVLELHGFTKIGDVWKVFTQHQTQLKQTVQDITPEKMPSF